ncbi:hypothetical protein [Acidithiobacillus caldus]|nr:hypothetical protein [Acidithiobacillus caldus]
MKKAALPREKNAAATLKPKYNTAQKIKHMLAQWMPVLLEVLRP